MNLTKPELTDVALAMTMPAEKAIQVSMPSVSVCFLLCVLFLRIMPLHLGAIYVCWHCMCVVYGCWCLISYVGLVVWHPCVS